jgi:hypothetical protein
LPTGRLSELLAVRAFLQAYHTVKSTPQKDWEKLTDTPMVMLVQDLIGLRAMDRL